MRFESVQDYKSCISKLMSGEPVNSLSGVGTNNNDPNPKIPKAIFVAGGFSDDEIAEMMQREEAKKLAWVCTTYLSFGSREVV
jgi:hypothetical protein